MWADSLCPRGTGKSFMALRENMIVCMVESKTCFLPIGKIRRIYMEKVILKLTLRCGLICTRDKEVGMAGAHE